MVACAGCDETGCDGCNGTGEVRLTTCPLEFVTSDTWEAIEMAGFAKRGILPVPGGALDQCAKFMDACRFIWSEQSRARAERNIPDEESS